LNLYHEGKFSSGQESRERSEFSSTDFSLWNSIRAWLARQVWVELLEGHRLKSVLLVAPRIW